ncbi:MAG: Npt1/Npt2 family nucleotide transporter [Saprospiraceae bacterium]
MSGAIRKILKTTFDIREGEELRALLMQVNIFLIISTLLIVKPTVNGLFLTKFGVENLPYAFILVAVAAAIVSTYYSRLLHWIPLNRIMKYTHWVSICSLILFGIFLRFNIFDGPVLFLLYIWVSIFAVLATSQFWVLANLVFNAREAKRLFGFVGAGAIAGGIFGGYLTSVLANFMNSEYLLFVCAGFLSFCLPINKRIWKEHVDGKHPPFQKKKRPKGFSQHPFFLIKDSKHLTYIAGIVGVSVMVAKLVDYQFGGISSKLITDPDELTAFFGFWFSTFNVVSLILQLFLTQRVVGRFGVGSSLFFLPTFIFVAASILLMMPELLLAAIFLKMSDGGLKQSINKAAMELLILPISTDVKNQTKTFIDVFVDSLATGVSGIVLIFLVKGLDLSTKSISLMIIALVLLWMYLAYLVRGEYLKSFRTKILEGVEKEEIHKQFDFSKISVLNGLKKVLEHGTEKQILYILGKVREIQEEYLLVSTHQLLTHPSTEVRVAALQNLYFYKNHSLNAEIEPLTRDPSQKIKIAAFEYLLEHTPDDKVAFLEKYLNDDDYKVRGAALVSLAKETRGNPQLQATFRLEDRVGQRLEKIPFSMNEEERTFRQITVMKTIGHGNLAAFYKDIIPYFENENPEIVKQAIAASSLTLSPFFLEYYFRFLEQDEYRTPAQEALVNYGPNIISALLEKVKSAPYDFDLIRLFPAVSKKIGTQEAIDFNILLFDFEDSVVRQEALRALNTLRNNYPYLRFDRKSILHYIFEEAQVYQDTLSALYAQVKKYPSSSLVGKEDKKIEARQSLIQLLEKRLDRNIERIFRLLGLRYPLDDIMIAYKGIQSEKDDMRLNSLEFLDNLLEPNLKKVLIPIVETAMLETISEAAIKNLNLKIPEEYDCFQLLLNGKDVRIKLAVLYLIGELKDAKYEALVRNASYSRHPKVKDFALTILNSLQK